MTKEVIIQLRDDFDGELGDDVETREFAVEGVVYEIELSVRNYNKFLDSVEPYRMHARPQRRKKTQKKQQQQAAKTVRVAPSVSETDIRQWALANDVDVGVRGRLPAAVKDQYRVAHSGKRKR